MSVRREALRLVLLVLGVDALFIGTYYLAHLGTAPAGTKLGFTVLWTAVNLIVVVRGLSCVRGARPDRAARRLD